MAAHRASRIPQGGGVSRPGSNKNPVPIVKRGPIEVSTDTAGGAVKATALGAVTAWDSCSLPPEQGRSFTNTGNGAAFALRVTAWCPAPHSPTRPPMPAAAWHRCVSSGVRSVDAFMMIHNTPRIAKNPVRTDPSTGSGQGARCVSKVCAQPSFLRSLGTIATTTSWQSAAPAQGERRRMASPPPDRTQAASRARHRHGTQRALPGTRQCARAGPGCQRLANPCGRHGRAARWV